MQSTSPFPAVTVIGAIRAVGLFVLLLAVVVGIQWQGDANTGFIANDAAAHYVTGLAVHDWLRGLPGTLGGNPLRFVIDYHAHLPLTGFGLWPPLYHGVLAVWMMVAGTSKASVLLLSGVVAALTGAAVGLAVARQAGWACGVVAGLLMAANPLVQRAAAELMLDLPCALASFLAAWAYAAYLARGSWRLALLFSACAVAAMLVKYNALALALVPPLCVLILRRWDLLLRPSFYLPAIVVAVMVGPLYLKTHGFVEQGFRFTWGVEYVRLATSYNLASLLEGLTPLAVPFALLGLGRVLWKGGDRGAVSMIEVACASLALAVFLFLLAVPVALQDRYLLPALAALLVLAGCELGRLVQRLRQPAWRALAIAAPVAVAAFAVLPPARQPQDMLAAAVAAMQTELPHANPVILLVADAETEPALIAEIAISEPRRPRAWVIRGARLLGGGGFNNADYQPRFATPADILPEIDRYGVAVVIFQRSTRPDAWGHIGQFATLLEQAPDRFERVFRTDGRAPVDVLRVRGNEGRIPDPAALTELSGPRALMRMVSKAD
jgi:hypothetical protein